DMQEVERLASLGQLSAGVAHELNNAITVISRGSAHIIEQVLQQLQCNSFETEMINAGLHKGRVVSSAEARKIARELKKDYPFSDAKLRDYARTGMGELLANEPLEVAQRAFSLWNLGASLHDLQLAVKQSEHVINSMRNLASTNVVRQPGCDINGSLEHALSLLSNPLTSVTLKKEFGSVPPVFGNSAELVQIWTNIVKNAIDAMEGIPKKDAQISIRTEVNDGFVQVTLIDSGPGIPPDIVDEIFKPHVTTKKSGQTFGLGLGLTIVQKIVKRYDGDLSVSSSPAGTTFIVKIPIGESQ
ncbi:MAG: GHKL domain-containing protein, partial [Candidatus Omnitrophica bacterium]|nr:GHKL domain-containing protein [Candidatus Omnitrophota bacterium]